MTDILEIPDLDYSDEVRFGSRPAVSFYLGSASYLNKKASSILDLKNEDLIALYYSEANDRWFIMNHPSKGVPTKKDQGNFKFCDTKKIKMLFDHYQIKGKKASFILGSELEPVSDPNIKVLLIKPKAYNVK